MSGDASSSLLLFIVALVVAAMAAGAMTSVVGGLALQLQERGHVLTDAMGTDLAIVNDPVDVPYNATSHVLTLYIKDTGTVSLTPQDLSIFVDGRYAAFNYTLLGGARGWDPGTVLQTNVTAVLSAGDHRARAVHTPNIADTLDFRT